MSFVYDHSVSPKQNVLRSRGEAAETYAGVISPNEAAELSNLTGWGIQKILALDIRFCLDDIRQ